MRTPSLRLPPLNDYERSVLQNVEEHGWHCTSVAAGEVEEEEPPFSYTVGLFQRFGASELIVFGLEGAVAHSIFSTYVNRLWVGDPIPLDRPCTELIDNYSAAFVSVPRACYNDFVYSALWFYAEIEFPLHQLVWPGADGKFPWNASADRRYHMLQPVLGASGGA